MLKEKQEIKQFRKQGRKQFGNSSANCFARRFSKAMIAAWCDTTEDDETSKEEEEATIALMAKSESDSDDEPLESLAQLMEKVRCLSKVKLEELLFTLMDECDSVNTKNCMLKDVCPDLKRDIRRLEHTNEVFKSERLKFDEKTLVLHEDLNKLKETLSMREEVFNTNFSKLESESLQIKQNIESLVCENHKLLERLKKAESNLTANRS